MSPPDDPPARMPRAAFLPGREAMSIMDAIYSRRTVRDFAADDVPDTSLHALLYAAVQAPSVVAGDLWGFTVIQDRALLSALSNSVGHVLGGTAFGPRIPADHGFNIFFNAGTLVVICGRAEHAFAEADCWLAAENLMLAACGMGLGSCVIGLAVEVLNRPEWKARFEIPPDMMAVAPIILGTPARGMDPVHRPASNIFSWVKG